MAESEERITRLGGDSLGDELVKRDRISEIGRAWVGRRSQKGQLCRMSAVDAGMRDTRKNGEVASQWLEDLQIGRCFIIQARLLGKQERGVESETRANGNHPAWR